MYVISKENKFFIGFICGLIVFTAVTISSVASNETSALAVVPEESESDRAPASLKVAEPKPAKMKFQSVSINFCELNTVSSLQLNVNGQFVQVKGRGCSQKNSYSDVKIINQTNGYTASIMPFGRDQYQTDLIQLDPGKNQLLIKYTSPKGVLEERKVELSAEMIGPQI